MPYTIRASREAQIEFCWYCSKCGFRNSETLKRRYRGKTYSPGPLRLKEKEMLARDKVNSSIETDLNMYKGKKLRYSDWRKIELHKKCKSCNNVEPWNIDSNLQSLRIFLLVIVAMITLLGDIYVIRCLDIDGSLLMILVPCGVVYLLNRILVNSENKRQDKLLSKLPDRSFPFKPESAPIDLSLPLKNSVPKIKCYNCGNMMPSSCKYCIICYAKLCE